MILPRDDQPVTLIADADKIAIERNKDIDLPAGGSPRRTPGQPLKDRESLEGLSGY
jgi:hypothetical protein